jgi:hypothetical protein
METLNAEVIGGKHSCRGPDRENLPGRTPVALLCEGVDVLDELAKESFEVDLAQRDDVVMWLVLSLRQASIPLTSAGGRLPDDHGWRGEGAQAAPPRAIA